MSTSVWIVVLILISKVSSQIGSDDFEFLLSPLAAHKSQHSNNQLASIRIYL